MTQYLITIETDRPDVAEATVERMVNSVAATRATAEPKGLIKYEEFSLQDYKPYSVSFIQIEDDGRKKRRRDIVLALDYQSATAAAAKLQQDEYSEFEIESIARVTA